MILKPLKLFTIFILLLPFHTGTFQVLKVEFSSVPTGVFLLQTWKEALLALLLGLVILQVFISGKITINYPRMILLLIGFIGSGVIGLMQAPDLNRGLYGFRGTYEAFLVFLVVLLLPIDIKWLQRIIPKIIIIGVIIALIAMYQSLFLSYDFVLRYYAVDGRLPSVFSFMNGTVQRAIGTFSSPNSLSLYLAFLIILIININLRTSTSNLLVVPCVVILFAAILLTVSRSGWLAVGTGLGISFLLYRHKQKLILILTVLAIIAVPISIAAGLDNHLINTLSGREVSANYRIEVGKQNLETIITKPLGVGLGRVGARVLRFGTPITGPDYYPTESYILQLGMELGLPGLLFFFAIVSYAGVTLFRNIYQVSSPWCRAIAVSSFAALCGALVHAMFIPSLQDLTVSSYLWFLVGLGMRLPTLEAKEQFQV